MKDAVNEALRYWVINIEDTHYLMGSVLGPHPFPLIVRDFQSVISKEAREQSLALTGALPDAVIACIGGGSNAMGMFYHFLADTAVELIGVEQVKGWKRIFMLRHSRKAKRESCMGPICICFKMKTDKFRRHIPSQPDLIIRG